MSSYFKALGPTVRRLATRRTCENVRYSSFLLSGVEEGGGGGIKRSWADSGRKEYLGHRKAYKDHEESRKRLFMERGLILSIMKRAEGVIYGESSKEAIYGSKRRL